MRKIAFAFTVALTIIAACTSSSGNEEIADTNYAFSGEEIYTTMCVACHGIDGKLGFSGSKDLSISTLPLEDRIEQITHGKGAMNAFEGILTTKEIETVAIYIEELRQ